ncbi:MAG: hypothetical protein GY820_40250 [Gammaproteobacteria bacterium]|nr:hypothetical protein [Gammaproteobacteria bacterium]
MDQAVVTVKGGIFSCNTPMWVLKSSSGRVDTVIGVTALVQAGMHVARWNLENENDF